MVFMRTFYRQTGALVDSLIGSAYVNGPLASAGSMSTRTANPVIMASLSANTGSISVDALSLMNLYYGSGVFSSGYVYIPVAVAQNQSIAGSQWPVGIGVILSIASYARSNAGKSGSVGMGFFNSGSTARFAVLGVSTASGIGTYVSTENVLVTFLLASSPQLNETL